MDRPSGPLGAATQSSRPIDTGPPRPAPLNTAAARRVGNPAAIRHVPSSSSIATQSSNSSTITDEQVIDLVAAAMRTAREDHENLKIQAATLESPVTVPGITIDLSHKQISNLPEETIEILQKDLERLALSHNQLTSLPLKFSALSSSLRYLNMRSNRLREFPSCICSLATLEILDVGRNSIKLLPLEIFNLKNLTVLSLQKNRLVSIPEFIADMPTLQVLKLEDNLSLKYPPLDVIMRKMPSPTDSATEVAPDDKTVTIRVKDFLKGRPQVYRSETESGGEDLSEGAETPRALKQRSASGRFPIKVNGSEVPDIRSPALPRPPPIPSRSHYRGLSQQNAAFRRPGVMPLTIAGINERGRSNSELNPNDRAGERSRRMGIVTRKTSDLGTVDEMKINNRYSHYRGLSHGSALQDRSNGSTRSPASPADAASHRPTYVKRLSSLPERKQESVTNDPVVEAAKSILYALVQVHPLIQNLLSVTREPTNNRNSLEWVLYNTTAHVEDLERDIQEYDTFAEGEEESSPRSNSNVHRTCVTCVSAYIHVCGLLQENVQALLNNGDPRYIRSLLLNVFGSIAEIRNASAAFLSVRQDRKGFQTAQTKSDNSSKNEGDGPSRSVQDPSNGQRKFGSFGGGNNGYGRIISDDEEPRNTTGSQGQSKYQYRKNGYGRLTDDEDTGSNTSNQPATTQPSQRTVLPAPARLRKPTMMSMARSLVSPSDDATGGRTPTTELASRSRRPTAMGPPRVSRDRSVTPTSYERMDNHDGHYQKYSNHNEGSFGQPAPIDLANQLTSALAPLASATPRSGTFVSGLSTATSAGENFADEDTQFDRIYLNLRDNTGVANKVLPLIGDFFTEASTASQDNQYQGVPKQTWRVLLTMCDRAIANNTTMQSRLSTIKLKDNAVRASPSWWQLIDDFVGSITDILLQVRELSKSTNVFRPLFGDLKQLQQSFKTTSHNIQNSPWRKKSLYQNSTVTSYVPLPMTPQNAALGPAAQATIPSTPQSALFAPNGHRTRFVDQRAEPSASMSSSVSSSRNGTMTTTSYDSVRSFEEHEKLRDINNRPGPMDPTSNLAAYPSSRGYNYRAGVGNQ